MDWFLSLATVTINFLIGRKWMYGWLIMSFMGFVWIYYAIFILHPAQYGLVPASILNIGIGISSFIKWYKEDRAARNWFYTEVEKLRQAKVLPAATDIESVDDEYRI